MDVSSALLAAGRQSVKTARFLHPVEVALLMARRIENISASVGVAFPVGALTETSSIDEKCIF